MKSKLIVSLSKSLYPWLIHGLIHRSYTGGWSHPSSTRLFSSRSSRSPCLSAGFLKKSGMEMHLVPCRPYRAHWIGQSGPLVPQLAALPNPTGKTNGPAPSLTSRSHRVPYQSSSVQKLHQARPSTSKSWTAEEDKKLMCLRNKGLTWTAISKELPGRTHLACRLRMQNYLSRPYEWTGNKQTWVAESYDRYLLQTQNPNKMLHYLLLHCWTGKSQSYVW